MPFTLKAEELSGLFEHKLYEDVEKLGGVEGIAAKLSTNLENGLSTKAIGEVIEISKVETAKSSHHSTGDEAVFEERRAVYGNNALPDVKSISFLEFCLEALKDKILLLLIGCAVIEIAIGIWKMVSHGEKTAIIDGFAIVIAIVIVVLVSAGNDYRKQQQFRNLSNVSSAMAQTMVVRDGSHVQVPNAHVMVGDVLILNAGDVLCCDGLFISGYNVKCDESALTGESDVMSKDSQQPYLISGTKVVNGMGKMLVVATGPNSVNGRLMRQIDIEIEETPLQQKLSLLADQIAKFGISSAIVMIIILLVTYFAVDNSRDQEALAADIVAVFISAVTLVVVAVPEGLPLAVTIALAHATNRMLKDNNLVRHLSACETMGNATTICSDKTGTLTQNKMTVVAGTIYDSDFTNDNLISFSTDHLKGLLDFISTSININSTASETENQKGNVEFIGSKTEVALLEFTNKLNFKYTDTRKQVEIIEIVPFSSERKRMSTIVKLSLPPNINKTYILPTQSQKTNCFLFSKGASEIILQSCKWFINSQGKAVALDAQIRSRIEQKIKAYAEDALRTIGVAFKPLAYDYAPLGSQEMLSDLDGDGLIFMGLFGIKDPVRDEVPNAVKQCQKAGVVVRMVTGDNLITARSIAKQCGILTEDGIVMEGPVFRKLSPENMDAIVQKLQVLARSSPLDKQILVTCLKRLGETVAVTGDGTNDAPALRSADVGFSMGIAGTEVAKEASDIVLLDDNFASLVKAVIWGRSVYDSVRKFLQFQLTVNVSAVVITVLTSLISTVTSRAKVPNSALTAVQLLWVNLIMDTFAALALATDPPTPDLLDRKPAKKSDPLISQSMWKQIIGQAIYQIIVCFLVYLKPVAVFGDVASIVYDTKDEYVFGSTVLFNVFVFCQIFNELNSRSITSDKNIFKGVFKNHIFISIFVGTCILQALIIEFGGLVFKTVESGLDVKSWFICVAIGFGSIPVGFLIRLIPGFAPKQETVETVRHEINEVQIEVEDLVNSVVDSVEQTLGKSLTNKEKNLWKQSIRITALQLRAIGAFREMSREAFTEGVRVGAQIAMRNSELKENAIEAPEDLPVGLPIEKTLSRGQELWVKAATTVKREISVVQAFRRYRRPSHINRGSLSRTGSMKRMPL